MAKPDGSKDNPIPLPDGFVEFTLDLQSNHRGAFRLFTRAKAGAPWVVVKEGELKDTGWTVDAKLLRAGLKYYFAWLRTPEKLRVAFIFRPTSGTGAPAQAVVIAPATAGLIDGEVVFS